MRTLVILPVLLFAIASTPQELSNFKIDRSIFFTEASYYHDSLHGNIMANGEVYNKGDATVVAHRTFPFGTVLMLSNLEKKKDLVVVVQDRGPWPSKHTGNLLDDEKRQLDLSHEAAECLGTVEKGHPLVKVKILFKPKVAG